MRSRVIEIGSQHGEPPASSTATEHQREHVAHRSHDAPPTLPLDAGYGKCNVSCQLTKEQKPNRTKQELCWWRLQMYRIARESLALASVIGFVWMVCQVASLAG